MNKKVFILCMTLFIICQTTVHAFSLKGNNFNIEIDNPQMIKNIVLINENSVYLDLWNDQTIRYVTYNVQQKADLLNYYYFFPKNINLSKDDALDKWLNNIRDKEGEKIVYKEKLANKKGVIYIIRYAKTELYSGTALYFLDNTVYLVNIETKDNLETLKKDTLAAIDKISLK